MPIPSHQKMQTYTDQINDRFPVNVMWSGYYIRMFKKRNLVIGGSQDWTYFHNLDVIFKKVIFFNLPDYWGDTWIVGNDLFRLTTTDEFHQQFPQFDVQGHHVFAFDFSFNGVEATRYVLAQNVFLEIHEKSSGDGMIHYEDPFSAVGLSCADNRVLKK